MKKFLVIKIENYKNKIESIDLVYDNSLLFYLNSIRKNKVYKILTDYFFYEDIYQNTECEYFIDITNYLDIYQKNCYDLAMKIKNHLYYKLRLISKIGIGNNLFLAKTACNIVTAIKKHDIVFLTELEYIKNYSNYKLLVLFWQIDFEMMCKLNSLNIYTMEDVRNSSYQKLYQEFGYNAEHLINHSLGLDSFLIKDFYNPKKYFSGFIGNNSLN